MKFYIERSNKIGFKDGGPDEVAGIAVCCECGWERGVRRTDTPATAENEISCVKCGKSMNEKIIAALAKFEGVIVTTITPATASAMIAQRGFTGDVWFDEVG